MKPKLNAKEMTREFNELRQAHINDTYTGKELQQFLQKYGFNAKISSIMKSVNVFLCENIGASKLYSFRNEPLYWEKMEEILRTFRKSPKKVTTPNEEAIELLKSHGYQVRICKGFDVQSFKEDYPELYQKYLIYEDA